MALNDRLGGETPLAPTTPVVSNRVYVTNLAFKTSWQNLKDHFKPCGRVVHADVFAQGGWSKGCGIVEFETVEEASKAIDSMNGTELDGRKVFVREDREDKKVPRAADSERPPREFNSRPPREFNREPREPREQREPREPRRPRDFSDRAPRFGGNSGFVPSSSASVAGAEAGSYLFVNNLPFPVRSDDLQDMFKPFGTLLKAEVLVGHDGRSRGQGSVVFDKADSAKAAINALDGSTLSGRRIEVREDRYAK
eukprot:TRINITY_DN12816_c0_g1_i1.p1 TRINITY_DN12816_c0_g1~~TRINITY_DN12816_c0_g1_i1.p1  ORF type:complete len:274 (-),score=104.28 TRINITY_DN12816_c0_g1_i1:208-966(-)